MTLGNGEFAFTADVTGLQSLNNSLNEDTGYPLLTMSNFVWHTTPPERLLPGPHPLPSPFDAHKPFGLNYTYSMQHTGLPAHTNTTAVPYQIHCEQLNDPRVCAFLHMMPARASMAQLAFVLPHSPSPSPPPTTSPTRGPTLCSAVGVYCSSDDHLCVNPLTIAAHAAAPAPCQYVASSAHAWTDKPLCFYAHNNTLVFTPVDVNAGFFPAGRDCDWIQWTNTKAEHFSWCRRGTAACQQPAPPSPPSPPPSPGPAPQPQGPFRFLQPDELVDYSQTLDLWTGLLSSNFTVADGSTRTRSPVEVQTAVDSDTHSVSVRFKAPATLKLGVQLAFCTTTDGARACIWDVPDEHTTSVLSASSSRIDLNRRMDEDEYAVTCAWQTESPGWQMQRTGPHAFVLHQTAAVGPAAAVELTCRFASVCCVGPDPPLAPTVLVKQPAPGPHSAVVANASAMWGSFWQQGAMVDMGGTPAGAQRVRALELERRVILSLYQLRAQESGSMPPQESGLLYNSWTGKHHSEMRVWHESWKPLWGHPLLLARSDAWFESRLPTAVNYTRFQGYRGARWGKMLGENNLRFLRRYHNATPLYYESPNDINPVLVWHQPHPVFLGELEYRAAPTPAAKAAVLARLRDVVFATAEFLADFPNQNLTGRHEFDLGPPLRSAPEGNETPEQVWNPSFELVQFNVSLGLANLWRERLGLGRNATWDRVRAGLAALPTAEVDGRRVYNGNANCRPSLFQPGSSNCQPLNSHPAVLGAMGLQPGDGLGMVDAAVMNNTLDAVIARWNWPGSWGWDEPMAALTALRLGRFGDAMDLLLLNTSTNTYGPTGINQPHSTGMVSAYFPGNGGTLIAVAMACAGTESSPALPPGRKGFPDDWQVLCEGFPAPYL